MGPGVVDTMKDNQELWENFSYDSCIWTDGFCIRRRVKIKIYPDDVEYGKAEKTKPVAEQVSTSVLVFINKDGTTNRIVYPEW